MICLQFVNSIEWSNRKSKTNTSENILAESQETKESGATQGILCQIEAQRPGLFYFYNKDCF